ncbi:formin-like protein 3 [Vombatus ursinus]|uniref:formin-like protein 3 n=1 Tax=Vombatus ursinus TaxID=29139 RepID=UPI000FFD879E|nr:formin-like protein 3 [Vombatus ursinus]
MSHYGWNLMSSGHRALLPLPVGSPPPLPHLDLLNSWREPLPPPPPNPSQPLEPLSGEAAAAGRGLAIPTDCLPQGRRSPHESLGLESDEFRPPHPGLPGLLPGPAKGSQLPTPAPGNPTAAGRSSTPPTPTPPDPSASQEKGQENSLPSGPPPFLWPSRSLVHLDLLNSWRRRRPLPQPLGDQRRGGASTFTWPRRLGGSGQGSFPEGEASKLVLEGGGCGPRAPDPGRAREGGGSPNLSQARIAEGRKYPGAGREAAGMAGPRAWLGLEELPRALPLPPLLAPGAQWPTSSCVYFQGPSSPGEQSRSPPRGSPGRGSAVLRRSPGGGKTGSNPGSETLAKALEMQWGRGLGDFPTWDLGQDPDPLRASVSSAIQNNSKSLMHPPASRPQPRIPWASVSPSVK